MKKVFIASSIIFGVILIFWAIYNFAFKDDSLVENKASQETLVEEAPAEEVSAEVVLEEKIKDISAEGVIGPVFREENNKVLFYAERDGRVFSVDPDGLNKSVFASQMLPGISNVFWSPDQKRVISEFDGGTRRYSYDYETKTGQSLKAELNSPVWSSLGDKILYQYRNGKINELDLADPDGTNWKKVADIYASRAKIAPIPQTSLVTFWNYPFAGEETGLLSVGVLGGEVKKIFSGKFGADYLWSPDGKKGLVSFLDTPNGPQLTLGIIDYDGANLQDLKIPTWVSKCVWSRDGQTVFYALPGGIPGGAVVPDDYQAKKFFSTDTFWKVDLTTREQTRLIELEELSQLGEGLDAENLFLSANEKNLFFVNRKDGHLFRLKLAEKK